MNYWIPIGIGVLLLLYIIAIFNALIRLRNQVKNAWAQIDVQLKRRHDLIPNLIETVKGYMKHERETLESIVKARSQAMGARSINDKINKEAVLGGLMDKLMVVVENYPDLKSNTNFLSLQEELTSTENRIAFARQAYNDQILFYNNKRETFPSNLIAGMFNFKYAEHFKTADAEKAVPKVGF